jgi:hypothetical protein
MDLVPLFGQLAILLLLGLLVGRHARAEQSVRDETRPLISAVTTVVGASEGCV